MLDRWSRLLVNRTRMVLAFGIVAAVAAATYGLGVFDSLGQGGFDDPSTDASKELAHEQELFGNKNVDVVALYRSRTLTADDPAFEQEVTKTLARIPRGTTTSVVTAWEAGDPAMISTDKHAVQVLISLAGDTQAEQSDNNDRVVPALEADHLQTDIAGPWAVYKGVNETVSADLARAEAYSLPIVLILSLLIFGSLVAALMPVMVGALSVIGGLAVIRTRPLLGALVTAAVGVFMLAAYGGSSEGTVVTKTDQGVYDYACQTGATLTGPVAVPVWGVCSVPKCWRLVVRNIDGTTFEPCVSREEYDRMQQGAYWRGRTDR